MTIALADVLVVGLVSYAVTYTALDAAVPVIRLPREWLKTYFERRADAAEHPSPAADGTPRKPGRRARAAVIFWDSLHTLSGCSWCFGFWATIVVAIGFCHLVSPAGGFWPAVYLTLAAWPLEGLLATIVDLFMTGIHALDERE